MPKTIGFAISRKENEKRRALVPSDLEKIRNVKYLYFEKGYGEVLGYSDQDYKVKGANIGDSKDVYAQDIVCCVKAPGLDEQRYFQRQGQTLFGWIHAVQGRQVTDFLLERRMTAIAWEEMFIAGRHVFWRNNELAGEAGILHALAYLGKVPYEATCAVIGRGNVARGAVRVLEKMGSRVRVYDKKTISLLRGELGQYDIIVNAVLWDVFRKDRLIYRQDLSRMKQGAMIVDITCDEALEIETSRPTTFNDPVYCVDGILHYVVDHTASLFWKAATESISREVVKYVDGLSEGKSNKVLKKATVIEEGNIIDTDIIKFQKRTINTAA